MPITEDTEVEPTESILLTLTTPSSGSSLGTQTSATLSITDNDTVASASVVGRKVFYNTSSFDGNSAAANAADDGAIATDKSALLPGGTATFANYTSYSRGINGLMIDISGLPAGTLTASDFSFHIGNANDTSTWTLAATPTITVRTGAGVGGSDRVELTWADGAIAKTWLQVIVKATAATGLAAADTFYFGNAVGESGNVAANAIVNSTDEINARNNPRNAITNAAPITFAYDYNRDKNVNSTDQILARNNTTSLNALKLITPSGAPAPSAPVAEFAAVPSLPVPAASPFSNRPITKDQDAVFA